MIEGFDTEKIVGPRNEHIIAAVQKVCDGLTEIVRNRLPKAIEVICHVVAGGAIGVHAV